MKYKVKLEAYKRAYAITEAESSALAIEIVNNKLQKEGVEYANKILDQVMYDSVSIKDAEEVPQVKVEDCTENHYDWAICPACGFSNGQSL